MRIISGIYGGRKIEVPNNLEIRPTTDFAKVALFNILSHRFDLENIKVLDLFSGSGSISYEFASRGCTEVTAVEQSGRCMKVITDNIARLGATAITAWKSDAFDFINRCHDSFDIIFADPPFSFPMSRSLPGLVAGKKLLKEGGWFILEHPYRDDFSTEPGFSEKRVYGSLAFSIFTCLPDEPVSE